MYVDFNVGDKNYKLRLGTRQIVALEKQLGCNPIAIFGTGDTIPTVTTMVNVLFNSLQQLNHGINLHVAYSIFDEYIAEGHATTDFIETIIEIYKVSGIIRDEQQEDDVEKN